jgi:hypothetical protein
VRANVEFLEKMAEAVFLQVASFFCDIIHPKHRTHLKQLSRYQNNKNDHHNHHNHRHCLEEQNH